MSNLALYGHPFSSYTWKARIALLALGLEHHFAVLSEDHPENGRFVAQHGGPWGKFPLLSDDGTIIFESTSIIEWLDLHHGGAFIPSDDDHALRARTFDRIFDNYVMTPVQEIVSEHMRTLGTPDMERIDGWKERLRLSYAWLETWRETYDPIEAEITLLECAAAPALFYADWVEPLGEHHPLLGAWRAHLLSLPAVAQCVEEARPWRHLFPPGAPDRD